MAYGHTQIYTEGDTINYTHSSAVKAGDVIVVGSMTMVASQDLAANQRGGYYVEDVTLNVPKATSGGSAIGLGVRVYWDAGATQGTATVGSNKHLGVCIEANVDGDAFFKVRKTLQV